MKKENFLSLLNDIDDDFIKEAADFKIEKNRRTKGLWLRYGSLAAACFVIVLAAAMHFMPQEVITAPEKDKSSRAASENSSLPTLSVDKYTARAREPEKKLGDPSAQKDNNPWTEVKDAEVETLPVYENIAYAGEADKKAVPVKDQILEEKIQQTAAAVGMDVEEIKYSKSEDFDRPAEDSDSTVSFKAAAQTDSGTITATCSNFTKIEYDVPQALPSAYTVSDTEMTSEKAESVTAYLLGQFGKLMGFSNPRTSIRMFYDEGGNIKWILAGYDDQSDNVQGRIVNYNLKRMRFQLDEKGNLIGIDMMDNLASGKKIEEYPIISEKEAKALLAEGQFVATSGETPVLENIEKATLVYLTGLECNIFMPYYAFDVRIDESEDGLIRYSTYYVPAVREEYLDKMPDEETTASQNED